MIPPMFALVSGMPLVMRRFAVCSRGFACAGVIFVFVEWQLYVSE